jgi:hypothetical protein
MNRKELFGMRAEFIAASAKNDQKNKVISLWWFEGKGFYFLLRIFLNFTI